MSQDAHVPEAVGDRIVSTTFTLLTSNGTSAVLGVAFWACAARLYSPEFVGVGAAEINAMVLLSSFALINLGTVFPRFLYAAGSRAGQILKGGYATSSLIALVVSVVFLLVTPGHHSYIEPGFLPSVSFTAAVVLWVIFTIQDSALIGLRSPFWVPIENTSFSIVKIALLPVFLVVAPRVGVFTSWVLPVVACVVAINLYLFRRVLPAHVQHSGGAGVIPSRRVIGNILVGEYLGGLSLTAMMTLPALFVAVILGAAQAAYFQTPWLIGMSFDGLLFSFATSLIVEATVRPSSATATVRKSVHLALVLLGPSVIVIYVCAPWFLGILGSDYATHGTHLLQLLALSTPFMAVNVLYVTFARLARRVRRVFLLQITLAVIVLPLSYALTYRLGINGSGVAFLAGQGVVALVVLPSVVRQYRHPDMAPSFAPEATLVNRSGRASVERADVVDGDTSSLRPPERRANE